MDTDRFQRRGYVPPPKSSTVYVPPGEPIDTAIRRSLRGCAKANIPADIRRQEFYVSPGQRGAMNDYESVTDNRTLSAAPVAIDTVPG